MSADWGVSGEYVSWGVSADWGVLAGYVFLGFPGENQVPVLFCVWVSFALPWVQVFPDVAGD